MSRQQLEISAEAETEFQALVAQIQQVAMEKAVAFVQAHVMERHGLPEEAMTKAGLVYTNALLQAAAKQTAIAVSKNI